jgi:hypothetical protein
LSIKGADGFASSARASALKAKIRNNTGRRPNKPAKLLDQAEKLRLKRRTKKR